MSGILGLSGRLIGIRLRIDGKARRHSSGVIFKASSRFLSPKRLNSSGSVRSNFEYRSLNSSRIILISSSSEELSSSSMLKSIDPVYELESVDSFSSRSFPSIIAANGRASSEGIDDLASRGCLMRIVNSFGRPACRIRETVVKPKTTEWPCCARDATAHKLVRKPLTYNTSVVGIVCCSPVSMSSTLKRAKPLKLQS